LAAGGLAAAVRQVPGLGQCSRKRIAYLAIAWRLGCCYRTYPACEEDEVTAALDDPGGQLRRGPVTLTARGTATRRHASLCRGVAGQPWLRKA